MSQYILGVLQSSYSFKLAISNMPTVFFFCAKPHSLPHASQALYPSAVLPASYAKYPINNQIALSETLV